MSSASCLIQFDVIFALLFSYIIGAVPTGFLISRLCGVIDIRRHGSGNIGATNVARTLGWPFFIIVFLSDAGKAFANLWFLHNLGYCKRVIIFCAMMHLVGNAYSFFLGWSGGKGVASFVGSLFYLQKGILLPIVLLWIFLFAEIRTVGIATVITAFLVPFIGIFFGFSYEISFFCVAASVWVILRHRSNIKNFFNSFSYKK